MDILALIESPDHVCYRYRIEAFAWALAQRGMYLRTMPLAKDLRSRIGQLRAARQAATVILQRKLLPIWQLALLRRGVKRLVYDVDDAVFQRDSYHRKGPKSNTRTARFWATVYAADEVLVGNDYLRQIASAYVPGERVHRIPTCVEPASYRLAEHHRVGAGSDGPGIRLAWIGQQSTMPSLRCAERHLAAAAGRVPGLKLWLVCDRTMELPLPVVFRPWSAATESAELAVADIGISWLPDDGWSRGKCGLKVLQYMAAGLPVVANRVGMNREMVVDGKTGFLASDPGQWAEAIARLASDPSLRAAMGAAGRRLVEQHFSVAAWSDTFVERIAAVECRPDRDPAFPGRNARAGS